MNYPHDRYDTDLVPPPGALPPVLPASWIRAAQNAGLHTADAPSEPRASEPRPFAQQPAADAWSDVVARSHEDEGSGTDHSDFPSESVSWEKPSRKERRRARKADKIGWDGGSSEHADAGGRARVAKAMRWRLRAVLGNVTVTDTHATIWFVQAPGTWNMRPITEQAQFIRDEALVLAELRGKGVTRLHRRTVLEPWPVTEWAHAHEALAEDPLPDVDGALSWGDYLVGHQMAMLDGAPTRKRRYWGIELHRRSATARAIVSAADTASGVPFLGKRLTRWSEQVLRDEQDAAAEYIVDLERVMLSPGVEAIPADAAAMDYLLRRSAAVGTPLSDPAPAGAPAGWAFEDLPALSDIAEMTYTPGDGHTVVDTTVAGRTLRSYVTVLTVGRMAALPIPEQASPWQIQGDEIGLPVEWSERLTLHTREETLAEIRKQRNAVESQYKHYTVEHDETPPDSLAAQHALSRRLETEMRNGGALSIRVSGWWRMAVSGNSPQQVRDRVSALQKRYGPNIELAVENGQFHLLKEFMPGEPVANTAHKRRMNVITASAGQSAASDRIGDEEGIYLGETASISARPVCWNLYAAHDFFDKSGLTPIVGTQGAGKTHLAGMLTYQGVRMGAHAVILDPSGRLQKLARLPELAPFTNVYELTGSGARRGLLNVYQVVAEPDPTDAAYQPEHPDYAGTPDPRATAERAYRAAREAAQSERKELAESVLLDMLDSDDRTDRDVKEAIRTAIADVGGQPHNALDDVLDRLDEIAVAPADTGSRSELDEAGAPALSPQIRIAAGRAGRQLRSMSKLAAAQVLFRGESAGVGDQTYSAIADSRVTILTMPGLQIDDSGDASRQTATERMATPLIRLAAWLAMRLVYDKPPALPKLLFLDENRYLNQSQAGRTLNMRLSRDNRKYRVRAFVLSQLASDFLGLSEGNGDQDQSQQTDEVIIGRIGSSDAARKDALTLLGLDTDEGFEAVFDRLGGGRSSTYDKRTNEARRQRTARDGTDQARTYLVRLGGDIELVRTSWTHFTHLAHVADVLDSRAKAH
ncbi:MAG: ATP-binding protein [Rhodococcus sp. (in: high G+C Gram-positive bacteria)]